MGKSVEIQNVTFSYGDNIIFKDLSLAIKEKTFCTILGKTGCGKSTLAHILGGLEETHGYIKIDGLFLNPKNMDTIRSKTALLLENPESQFVTDNVFDEITFSLQNFHYSISEIEQKINKISHDFDVEYLLSRRLQQLSAGEKQLIQFVVALCSSPKLLILDEALSMIDRNRKKKIWSSLKTYQKENNMTILHFTDDVEDVMVGTEFIILSEGKVLLQSSIQDILHYEKVFIANQLELPFLVDLANKLRYYNTISSVEIKLEQLVNEIWK